MDILVKLLIILKQTALFSCRPEAQKSKPAATTSGLPKLNLTMVSNTSNQCDEFQGRRPKNYMKAWETKTEDPWIIIEIVSGLKLDFIDNPPSCSTISNVGFSKIDETAIDNEIENFLAK